MHFFVVESPFLRRINDSLCHRVREMFLHACCNAQKFVRIVSVEGDHFCDRWLRLGQCSRLIKDNRVRLRHRFQVSSAFYRNIVLARLTDCGKDGYRHRKF